MKQINTDQRVNALEQALIRAHLARTVPQFSADWMEHVVRDVRRRTDHAAVFNDAPLLIWRAAAVIALVSALLVGSIWTWTARQTDMDFSALLTMAIDDSIVSDR